MLITKLLATQLIRGLLVLISHPSHSHSIFPFPEQSFAVGLLLLSATTMLAHWRDENKIWCSKADLCVFLHILLKVKNQPQSLSYHKVPRLVQKI